MTFLALFSTRQGGLAAEGAKGRVRVAANDPLRHQLLEQGVSGTVRSEILLALLLTLLTALPALLLAALFDLFTPLGAVTVKGLLTLEVVN